jgi:hypothetical protein
MKRTHTIYLTSKNRTSGTPSNYVVALPQIIDADPNMEVVKVCLKNFTTYNSWFIVKEGSNTIEVNGIPFQIPSGNYTYQRLAKAIEYELPNSTVRWIQEQNKMELKFPTFRTLEFDGLGTTLGFMPHEPYSGTKITSTTPMLPYNDPHLFIHLQNIAPTAEHLILSNHTGEMRVASILAKVLINASPFQLITHQQVLESDGIITVDATLNALEFFITGSDGREFLDCPDHELVLTLESMDVEDYDAKDMIDELREIRKWVRDLVTLKILPKNR